MKRFYLLLGLVVLVLFLIVGCFEGCTKLVVTILSPADGSVNVSINSALSWHVESNFSIPSVFDVYFGTSADSIPLVANDLAVEAYSPGPLATSTTYYWQIKAEAGKKTALSEVASFTTGTYGAVYFFEDFESGDLTSNPWVTGGDAVPFVQSEETQEGTYTLELSAIGADQSCFIEVEVNLPQDAVITFYRKTSIRITHHYLNFYIDDVLAGNWSGKSGWYQVFREIPAGTHTLKWEYKRDNTGDAYENAVWLDKIAIYEAMDLGEEVSMPDSYLRAVVFPRIGKAATATAYAKELGDFTELEADNLGIADITGLEYMESLKWVWLNTNSISDITPLQGLTNIEWLYLQSNQISDITSLQNLTNLDYLNLLANQITDISPLENITGLYTLALSHNQISDISSLPEFTNILHIYLDYNQISDISVIGGYTTLIGFYAINNNITSLIPLENLTNLKILYLSGNPFLHSELSHIYGLTQITNLQLEYLDLTNTDVTFLASFTALYELRLGGNEISELGFLEDLTAINSLWLSSNNISDITELQNLTNLRHLVLDQNSITDIQPLVDNSGVASGDFVYLRYNLLDVTPGSDDMTDIQALIDRGVNVYYLPQK